MKSSAAKTLNLFYLLSDFGFGTFSAIAFYVVFSYLYTGVFVICCFMVIFLLPLENSRRGGIGSRGM